MRSAFGSGSSHLGNSLKVHSLMQLCHDLSQFRHPCPTSCLRAVAARSRMVSRQVLQFDATLIVRSLAQHADNYRATDFFAPARDALKHG
jgi:hypothetical protein